MTKTQRIAVVILNWNGEKLLGEFMPSVVEHSSKDYIDVIVADNGSTDRSIEFLQQNFPSVRIIDLKKNYGFAEGYNRALEQVEADYFVLLNSDVKVTGNWIETCLKKFDSDPDIAAIQPKILSYNHPGRFEYAGAAGGYIDKFGYPFCRGRILNNIEKDEGQYDKSSQIFWASGASMFVRADAFKKAGALDGDFWAHMEEIDLCWRFKSMGYKVVYEPASTVYHLGGGTLSYSSPSKVYLNFRNNLFMLFKNLPSKQFKRIFLARMVLDAVAAFKFLADAHFRNFGAVFKAHISFYQSLGKLLKKRRNIQKRITVEKHSEIYRKSLMWKFFIQKRRKFSDLDFYP